MYSRILKEAQRRYATTERELLSIVEMLKEFKSILLEYEKEIHTGHKNLFHETTIMSSDRVIRWQLIIEEYRPEIKYVLDLENIVADVISRLSMVEEEAKTKEL